MITGFVCGALVLGALTVAFLIMALDIRDAERRVADARVDAQTRAGQLAIAESNAATERARADNEKRRADALDDLLATYADAGPVDGSYERLLQKWRSARTDTGAPDGAGRGAVLATSATSVSGSFNVSGRANTTP